MGQAALADRGRGGAVPRQFATHQVPDETAQGMALQLRYCLQ